MREISEENIEEALRDIRVSLLEADVDFKVVRRFIGEVKTKALGQVVQVVAKKSKQEVTAGEHFIKICQDELEALMGPADSSLNFSSGVTKIMMIGLQGAGKTTTTGKLANYLKAQGRSPMLVAADIYRPAAVEQLKILGQRLDVPVFHQADTAPPDICQAAEGQARKNGCDVLLSIPLGGWLSMNPSWLN